MSLQNNNILFLAILNQIGGLKMSILIIIIIMLVFGAVMFYTNMVTFGYDNFKGITLELDEMYNNDTEIAYAAVEELRKRGKECEIVELGKGYPKLLVNGNKYSLTYKMASMRGFPVQVVQLKLCKG